MKEKKFNVMVYEVLSTGDGSPYYWKITRDNIVIRSNKFYKTKRGAKRGARKALEKLYYRFYLRSWEEIIDMIE